jgi:hypothetical protein
MRTLFAKILTAQVLTVVLALLVVTVVSRAYLNRGFLEFLERQEAAVLNITAPALADLYQARGGWDFLRGQPENWLRILRQSRGGPRGPDQNRSGGRMQRGIAAGLPPAPPADPTLRWLGSMDRLKRPRTIRCTRFGLAVMSWVGSALHPWARSCRLKPKDSWRVSSRC